MASGYRITDGSAYVELLITTHEDIFAQRGGLGEKKISPNVELSSSKLADGGYLRLFNIPPIVETYKVNVLGDNIDDLSANLATILEKLYQAIEYQTTDWQDSPIYLEDFLPNEASRRYSLILGWQMLSIPDTHDVGIALAYLIDGGTITLVREPFWWSDPPGSLPDYKEVFNPSHPYFPGSAPDDLVVIPNMREDNEVTHIYIYDPERFNSTISAFADAGGGQVTVSTPDTTGLQNGDTVVISGTGNYNGEWTIANVVANTSFEITTTFVATETGVWVRLIEGTITGVVDDGGGNARIQTGDTRGLTNGDTVIITGTTSYNGQWSISNLVANTSFDIIAAYVASETGLWAEGEFSANLVDDAYYSLDYLNKDTGVGVCTYFGCEDGVFHNVVLQLAYFLAAVDYDYEIEYSTSSGFSAFDDESAPNSWYDDFGNGLQGHETKDQAQGSGDWRCYPIAWYGPDDWDVQDIGTGATIHWIRIRVTTMDGYDRDAAQWQWPVYTATQPYIEIKGETFSGDDYAQLFFKIWGLTGDLLGTAQLSQINKIWIAAKQAEDEGERFLSRINFNDVSNPSPWAVSVENDTTIVDDPSCPDGRVAECVFTSDPELNNIRARAEILNDLNGAADFFRGKYRPMLVCRQENGDAGDVKVQLRVSFSYVGAPEDWYSDIVQLQSVDEEWEIVDFNKELSIPVAPVRGRGGLNYLRFLVYAYSDNGSTPNFKPRELWLIPSDEWLLSIEDPNPQFLNSALEHDVSRSSSLEVDAGILTPYPLASMFDRFGGGNNQPEVPTHTWPLTSSEIKIKPGVTTRFHIFYGNYLSDGVNQGEPPLFARGHLLAAWQVTGRSSYLFMRGNRS